MESFELINLEENKGKSSILNFFVKSHSRFALILASLMDRDLTGFKHEEIQLFKADVQRLLKVYREFNPESFSVQSLTKNFAKDLALMMTNSTQVPMWFDVFNNVLAKDNVLEKDNESLSLLLVELLLYHYNDDRGEFDCPDAMNLALEHYDDILRKDIRPMISSKLAFLFHACLISSMLQFHRELIEDVSVGILILITNI